VSIMCCQIEVSVTS